MGGNWQAKRGGKRRITTEFHGIVKQGRFLLPPVQKQLRERLLASMKDGTRIKETLIKEGRAKSPNQVRAHFGLVVEMIRKRFEDMGVDICGICPNKDMIHDILKKACSGVGDMGETLGLSEMTTEQASKFFENCRTWAATQLQLDIPNPDINWRQKKVEVKNEGKYNRK